MRVYGGGTADNVQLKRAIGLSVCSKNHARFSMPAILKIS